MYDSMSESDDDPETNEVGVKLVKECDTYKPADTGEYGRDHPAQIEEGTALSWARDPQLDYTLALPKRLYDPPPGEEVKLSALQIQAIRHACAAHLKENENGVVKGFLLGDGTGMGKTRTIAGIIVESFIKGAEQQKDNKAVWVTVKDELVPVIDEEFRILEPDAHINRLGRAASLPPYGVVVVTYRKLASTRYFNQLREWMDGNLNENESLESSESDTSEESKDVSSGEDENGSDLIDQNQSEQCENDFLILNNYSGLIIFDEAHMAKNCINPYGKSSAVGRAVDRLQMLYPKARVVYVSATSGYQSHHFLYMHRLGLWGRGTSFSDMIDFETKMSARHLAALEYMALTLKQQGVFLSRQISLRGVTVVFEQVEEDSTAKAIYNRAAHLAQLAASFLEARKPCYTRTSIGHFYSQCLQFFLSLIFSSKIVKVAQLVRSELNEGRSVIVGFQHTGQAGFDKFLKEGREGLPYSSAEYSLRHMLKQAGVRIGKARLYHRQAGTLSLESLAKVKAWNLSGAFSVKRRKMESNEGRIFTFPTNTLGHYLKLDAADMFWSINKVSSIRCSKRQSTSNTAADFISDEAVDMDGNDDDYDDDENEDEEDSDMERFIKRDGDDSSDNDAEDEEEEEEDDEEEEEEALSEEEEEREVEDDDDSDSDEGSGLDEEDNNMESQATETETEEDDSDSDENAAIELESDISSSNSGGEFERCSSDIFPVHTGTRRRVSNSPEPEVYTPEQRRMEAGISRLFHELVPFLPICPIDELRQHLWDTELAEITSRTAYYEKDVVSAIEWVRVLSSRNNKAEEDKFMNDRAKVALISDAGSIGISLHANPRRANRDPRTHITIEVPWAADKFTQQLGRSHRSGQVQPPKYVLIKSWIPAEVRTMAVIARRLQQMSAVCQGQAKGNVMSEGLSGDIMTLAGAMSINGAIYTTRTADLYGLKPIPVERGKMRAIYIGITRVLNRLLMNNVEVQLAFMQNLEREMKRHCRFIRGFYEFPEPEDPSVIIPQPSETKTWHLKRGTSLVSMETYVVSTVRDWPESLRGATYYKTKDNDVFGLVGRTRKGGWRVVQPDKLRESIYHEDPTIGNTRIETVAAKRLWSKRSTEMNETRGCIHRQRSRFCDERFCWERSGTANLYLISGDLIHVWDCLERVLSRGMRFAKVTIRDGESDVVRIGMLLQTKEKERIIDQLKKCSDALQ